MPRFNILLNSVMIKNIATLFLICTLAALKLSAAEVDGTVSSNGEKIREGTRFAVLSPGISPVLDEKTYESRIIHYLTDKGLVYAPNDPRAIKVSYTYSVDKGSVGTVAAPVYGPAYGGAVYYGGGYRHRHGWGIGVAVPAYGVVGAVPQNITIFTRELILSFAGPHGSLLQQMTLVSPGPENDLRYVMPAMIHAALKKFPMEPGERKETSADIE